MRHFLRPAWSLRAKGIALLFGTALVPLFGAVYFDVRETERSMLSSTEELLAAQANQLSAELDLLHEAHLATATHFAASPTIRALLESREDASHLLPFAREVMSAAQVSDPSVLALAVLGPSGTILVANDARLNGLNVASHRFVRSALGGQQLTSSIYLPEPEIAGVPVVAYLQPIRSNNAQVTGVFAVWGAADKLFDRAKTFRSHASALSSAVLVDENGIRLASTENPELLFHPMGSLPSEVTAELVNEQRFGAGTAQLLADVKVAREQFAAAVSHSVSSPMFYVSPSADDPGSYQVARRLRAVPWTLFYSVRKAQVDVALIEKAQQRLLVATTIAVAVLAIGSAWSHALARPIESLSAVAEKIAAGKLDGHVPSLPQNDELGRMASSFNAIALRLKDAARLEEQLRQAQKMEVVGRLVGSVAHDFNNLLSVILSFGDALLRDLPAGSPARADVKEMTDAGRRAAALSKQLLLFSQPTNIGTQPANINDVVRRLERMIERVVGRDIAVVVMLDQALLDVEVDPGALEQVILNLVVNAHDAMPNGGTLTIATKNVSLDAEHIQTHTEAKSSTFALLEVTDTGVGMSSDVQRRIFEPFFTTKPPEKGTGLGLSTVATIVQRSSGHIETISELGVGTSFKIYLPSLPTNK